MTEKTSFSVEDIALSERKFLHDIANHIVIAQGMLTFIQKAAESKTPLEEKDVERIDKALAAITKMSALLKERRVVLNSQNDKTI
jgi:hypothetical protein